MNRARLAVPVALLLILGVGLGGCAHRPHPVAPKAWTADVCRALSPWRDEIASLNATAQQAVSSATTAEQTRTRLLELLDGARAATDKAASAVRAAGVPNVAGGAVIEDRFVTSLQRVSAAYRHARTTIGALDTADENAFYKGVAAAMTTLTAEYGKSGIDTNQLVSSELQTDFDTVAACR